MMQIGEIMNRNVITLRPDMTIKEASEIFAKNGISGAPVVDENGKLLGILTIKDILKTVKDGMESVGLYVFPTPFDFMEIIPFEIPEGKVNVLKELSSIRVGDVMEKRVHYAEPDMDIYDALNILVKKEISRLPVVKDGMVVGIVTRSDLLRAIAGSDEVSK